MIAQIWKRYNVSTMMILPIFWKITKDVFSKRENVHFPFFQLVLEYGLINTYLLHNNKNKFVLYLLFDKEQLTSNKNITKSPHFSLLELLLDSEYYESLEMYSDYVLVGLKIPTIYEDDIEKIIEGKYSKVSEQYKEELQIRSKTTHVPMTDNPEIVYIMKNNLPFAISVKAVKLRDELVKVIDTNITSDMEYYPKFNEEKENFTQKLFMVRA